MDQWLVRTCQNWIAGPYSKEQVCQLILEGKLTDQDEVCPANGYWISIYERDEVQSQLGISVQKKSNQNSDEITETQIPEPEDEDRTDPSLVIDASHEHTAVIQMTDLRETKPQKK